MGPVRIRHRLVHTIWGGGPVILWISLGGKPKWLPLNFGYHDVMRTNPILRGGEGMREKLHRVNKVCEDLLEVGR